MHDAGALKRISGWSSFVTVIDGESPLIPAWVVVAPVAEGSGLGLEPFTRWWGQAI